MDHFRLITISLPEKYTELDAARLKDQFPGLKINLNARAFSIEEEANGVSPSPKLRAVFTWIQIHM